MKFLNKISKHRSFQFQICSLISLIILRSTRQSLPIIIGCNNISPSLHPTSFQIPHLLLISNWVSLSTKRQQQQQQQIPSRSNNRNIRKPSLLTEYLVQTGTSRRSFRISQSHNQIIPMKSTRSLLHLSFIFTVLLSSSPTKD